MQLDNNIYSEFVSQTYYEGLIELKKKNNMH